MSQPIFFSIPSLSQALYQIVVHSLLVVVLLMIAIHQLDEKVSKNVHYVYILLLGITFGFSIVGIYTVFT